MVAEGGHGAGARRRLLAAEPFGYGLDTVTCAQAAHDLFPLVIAGEGSQNRLAGALLAAQLLNLGTKGFLGLANWDFIDAFDILLRLAPSARSPAVALTAKQGG